MTAQIFAGLKGDARDKFVTCLRDSEGYMGLVAGFVFCYFKQNLAEIKTHHKTRDLVWARQISMYIIRRDKPILSLKRVGVYFGGRDHSTVIYAKECVEGQLKVSGLFREQFKDIDTKLQRYLRGELSIADLAA